MTKGMAFIHFSDISESADLRLDARYHAPTEIVKLRSPEEIWMEIQELNKQIKPLEEMFLSNIKEQNGIGELTGQDYYYNDELPYVNITGSVEVKGITYSIGDEVSWKNVGKTLKGKIIGITKANHTFLKGSAIRNIIYVRGTEYPIEGRIAKTCIEEFNPTHSL